MSKIVKEGFIAFVNAEEIKTWDTEEQNKFFVDNLMNHKAKCAKESWPRLEEKKVAHIRTQLNRRNVCTCGFKGLHEEPIQGYFPHLEGADIDGLRWCLFIICPNCDYAWRLPKLISLQTKQED